jgi:pyruvate,water dikinase
MTFIRSFDDIGLGDVPLVGGKNASLGELYSHLSSAGVSVPNGFAITAHAYRAFMHETGLTRSVDALTPRSSQVSRRST